MPIFKYFLCVGSLLSALLFAWSVYLEPPAGDAQATPPPARAPEVFRPTPAPPIVEAEELAVGDPGPSTVSGRSHRVAKVAPAKKKQKTQVARRRVPSDRSFAYFPQTPSPFFFGWR
jgi:hypothetical protein